MHQNKKKLLLAASIGDHQGKQVPKVKSSKKAKPMNPQPKNTLKKPEALLVSVENLKLKPYNQTKRILPRSDSVHDTDILPIYTKKDAMVEFGSSKHAKWSQKTPIHLPRMLR